jgi:hypothetical protein
VAKIFTWNVLAKLELLADASFPTGQAVVSGKERKKVKTSSSPWQMSDFFTSG